MMKKKSFSLDVIQTERTEERKRRDWEKTKRHNSNDVGRVVEKNKRGKWTI